MPGMWVTAITPGMLLATESSIDTTDAPWVAAMASTVGRYSDDGKRSMAYGAWPRTICGVLCRVWGFPMILKSLAVFGAADLAFGRLAASSVSDPKVTLRPARATTWPFSVRRDDAGTRSCWAPAARGWPR